MCKIKIVQIISEFAFCCFLLNHFLSCLADWVCSYLAVKSIKKQHLVEVRSMANPPAAVKLALESICLLLGESTTDWKQIRSIIMRENFIPTIVNFSAEEIRWIIWKCILAASGIGMKLFTETSERYYGTNTKYEELM